MRKAAVDVGSNSLILTVLERTAAGWSPVYEETKVTGLGRGTKESRLLSPGPVEETLAALKLMFGKAQALGATSTLAGATMAVRLATNAGEFLRAAERQGTPVFVVPGDAEAQLGFLATANDPAFGRPPVLSVVDPGGHSTEYLTANRSQDGWKTVRRESVPVGAVGLRDEVMTDPSPGPNQQLAAVTAIDSLLPTDYQSGEAGILVVLGATGTNLVSIREKYGDWRPELVHGATLEYEEVGRAVGWLCGMDDQARSRLVGIEPGREKTLHAGALILERFMYAMRVDTVHVSVRGWRHALVEHPEALSEWVQTK